MYSFPKIRNILFFQNAVGEEIITPIQSVLILIVVLKKKKTKTQHFLHVFSEAENAILIMAHRMFNRPG